MARSPSAYIGRRSVTHPAGVIIDQSIEKDLRKHLQVPLEFTRLGITAEQIEFYELPTKPRKQTDKRALYIQETVEAEAMPAATLRELLSNSIEEFIPDLAGHLPPLTLPGEGVQSLSDFPASVNFESRPIRRGRE